VRVPEEVCEEEPPGRVCVMQLDAEVMRFIGWIHWMISVALDDGGCRSIIPDPTFERASARWRASLMAKLLNAAVVPPLAPSAPTCPVARM
jgi:hypothetical protein